jgi:hypothetical protein
MPGSGNRMMEGRRNTSEVVALVEANHDKNLDKNV